jgi:outer membrane protein assembly factor BamB
MRFAAVFLLILIALVSLSFATVEWSVSTAEAISGKPVLDGNKAIFGSYEGQVYGVNVTSGQISWTYDAQGAALEPQLAAPGTLAVVTESGKLEIISTGEGKVLAEADLGRSPIAMIAGGGRVFVAFSDNLSAYNLSGAQAWDLPMQGPIGQIGLDQDTIYFTAAGKLYAVSAQSGVIEWSSDAGDSFLTRPVRSGSSVYIGTTDGILYAFDVGSGRLKWSFRTEGWVMGTPLVTDDTVYFGSNDGNLYAVSLSGQERFAFSIGEGIWTQPEIYDSVGRMIVVFGGNDGNIYGIDSETGAEKWSFSASGKPGSTVMSGTEFLFGTSSGEIYALSPSPICSFVWPNQLDSVGSWPVEVEGRASAEPGISSVEVRVNNGSWAAANGKSDWYATVDFSNVPAGAATVECRSFDNAGNVESGEYSFVLLVKSDSTPLSKMYVSAPVEVGANEEFNISAKDARGHELRNLELVVGGKNMTGDSPFEIALGRSGIVPVMLQKPGFETASFTINGKGSNDWLLPALALVLVLAAGYFFVGRKLLKKK